MPKSLTIQQPKLLQRSFLLLDSGKPVGRLDRTGIFRQKVTASVGGRNWRFVRTGGLRESVVTVIAINTGNTVAVYRRPGLRQTGSVTMNGVDYRLKVSAWRSRYAWNDADGHAVITFSMGGIFKRSGAIEVADSLLAIPNYELLLPLGLYLGMEVEDANSSAAASAGGA